MFNIKNKIQNLYQPNEFKSKIAIMKIFFNFKHVIQNKKLRQRMKNKVEVAGIMGPVWFIGWLFTLGFLKVTFFKGLLALVIWPYYIGDFLAGKVM